jgi:uncharacterized protein (TIGR00730 family)
MKIHSVCVFCASASGIDATYVNHATEVGQKLALHQLELIYGGGKVGLMGAVADGTLEAGGRVTGIIPEFMSPHEIAHNGVSELLVVESMHERKLQMHERSDAVLTLPGGFGTFEELFEIVTWIQLGLYQKPVAVLNVNGYYDFLEKQLDHMEQAGLLKSIHRPIIKFCQNFEEALTHFRSFEAIPSIFDIRKKHT